MLWGNTAYCVTLNGEGLSRYSNKIDSVGLRKCWYCQRLPHIMAGNSWHVYGVEITLLSSYVSRMLNFRAATEYSDTRMLNKISIRMLVG